MEYKVGEIQSYDVIYIPEKDIIFCKNTTIKLPTIKKIVTGCNSRGTIPEKSLTITKDSNVITFGCLTTTMSNCFDILKQIKKLKNESKR